ncbi:type VI secretion system baseplate subunit TssE [Vibrio anguillarum]|uniref:type VI secretion system baseplate subunit TssE n=1 Tax=Vibrio anguillarum TaxID=55601 RepID=UPI00097E3327|nr:type VI secretion system baseplate subunit TssE [Vibrio anguillarum]MBF4284053.1 type VI secretion system baseplate subunit TssE [Vibrio anguillarum]MBF4289782.1 type VI secretion system baseplate subunit TssE [Vibrio anguillarum]MBF4341662.1 type VI secretion system baseplate subunit TssE [Vibrio anguillarum]MBF4358771.1 type VI secretion system baseplate subunit TssE [Vibrio anguillarum]MBF4380309.1 type VI secretion system baseplate subunit TssE [Vibrio anguillarum]
MTYIAPEESAFGVGFFERLEAGTKPISLTQGPNAWDVLQSIKRNVSNILNTRMGEAQSAPTLGLVDFNDATLETLDLSLRIKLAIQSCLDVYEPRLRNIVIRSESDVFSPLMLRFHIVAEINSDALHEKVQFNLLLDQNRKYRVY